MVYGSTLSLNATSSSGLGVVYASSNPSVATISGNSITVIGVGATVISASQPGNAFYNAATTVTQTLTVTPKPLTLTSATAQNKIYDRNNVATVTGTLSGVVGTDDVTFSGTGTFAMMNIGNGIAVSLASSLQGAQSGNYSLTQPANLSANITPKVLTVSNAVANNKAYDGTTAATISGTLSGVISPDDVSIASNAGTFGWASIGNNIPVTAQLTLGGANSGNYMLTQPTGLSANIIQVNFSAVLYGTSTICTGESANIYVYITGNPSNVYTVTYTNGVNTFVVNNYTSETPIPITPAQTSTFALVSVTRPESSVTIAGTPTVTVNQNVTYYADYEGDGYGDPAITITTCYGAPTSFVTNGTDCDPNLPNAWRSDTFYIDQDGDGYSTGSQVFCYGNYLPSGYSLTTNGTDCDDTNPAIFRSGIFFTDADSDGYSTDSGPVCYGDILPSGYATTTIGADCDDNDAAVHSEFGWQSHVSAGQCRWDRRWHSLHELAGRGRLEFSVRVRDAINGCVDIGVAECHVVR
ncbi:MAG: hypothetical protein EOO39_27025 [Cytophagaceae bacterium]|nr:MAG: hypothetical protein EOO39_27025 [Cytophagaceae bacterium]